jgi:hypothetical protein
MKSSNLLNGALIGGSLAILSLPFLTGIRYSSMFTQNDNNYINVIPWDVTKSLVCVGAGVGILTTSLYYSFVKSTDDDLTNE